MLVLLSNSDSFVSSYLLIMDYQSKSSTCVHKGTQRDQIVGGINTPIHTSSAYAYLDVDAKRYPRYFNTPNQKVVIEKVAALEKAEDGLLLSSGMAAISTALFGLVSKGDHCIFQNDIYGGTYYLVGREMERFGIEVSLVNSLDPKDFEKAIRPNTKVIYIESPSNPLLKIIDISAIAEIARKNDIKTVIDNTFASPINQRPIELGIDVVTHSGTKYLGGHSDICCGMILSTEEIIGELHKSALNFGGSLNAETCYLLERSIKTLALRVERQNENAMAMAEFLHELPEVEKVYYPGLPSHAGHAISKNQMDGYGGMLSFELQTEDTYRFQKSLKVILPTMSLGGIESTICSSAMTSHRKLRKEERLKAGISDGLLRLSVGIEGIEDLQMDIVQALEKAGLRKNKVLH